MSGQQIALVLLGAVVVALVVLGLSVSRLGRLTRRVGSFECAFRRSEGPSASWVTGVGQYGADSLYWWRARSLSVRPTRCWRRSAIVVSERAVIEESPRFGRQVAVRCTVQGEAFDLLMSPEASAGLTSWLEATPPTISRVI
ncbi:DUF2550 domain-containing protein [Cellulomonas cellasea]|uniref:DUF2550 domain-containing protein n=1 Tax=Cellulomonas cellasea TaxID=43670 RepID=A0A7W4YCK0_9CELL|nr:DUF2550 domain-containing protein [Cellulomonas cellasea]MBB2923782.1 hypothetical protein [Cellulomonas cellasea]